MAFPTGAINDQVYTTKYGTRYKYVASSNTWLQYALPLYGSAGSQGVTGASGLTGSQGSTGVQGYTGLQSAQGIQGATGGPGVQGVTGAQGATGGSAQGLEGFYGSATGTMSFTFDGNNEYLIPWLQSSVKIPYRLGLSSWEVVTRETGFFSADVNVGTYSGWPTTTKLNGGETGVYVQNDTKNQSASLSGWTSTDVLGADYLQLKITGVTGVRNASVSLGYYRY